MDAHGAAPATGIPGTRADLGAGHAAARAQAAGPGLGLAFALTTMLLWAVLPHVLKVVLRELDVATITWFRFTLSAAVLGSLLARRGALPRVHRMPRPVLALLALATLFLAANYQSFLVGLDYTSSANAQVLIQLSHLLLALGGITVFGERFTRAQWLGFAVLVSGLALFFSSRLQALAGGGEHYAVGSLWIVVAAVTWAIYGLAQKQLLRWLPAQSIMVCIYAGCALLFTPLASPGALLQLGGVALGLLVFCGLNTVVAYGAFAEALLRWDASRVSAVFALTPLATLAFAALGHQAFPGLVDFEPITPLGMIAAGLVVGGSLVTALAASPSGEAAARDR
jgi:drug/metabolite transporter (DMT)-like permease